ncbi:replication protein A 70 kDa DNA-binding subunit isoform X2 [Arapaima gigas]
MCKEGNLAPGTERAQQQQEQQQQQHTNGERKQQHRQLYVDKMTVKLTEGAIEALTKGNTVNNAVLQVVNIRKLESGSGPARFRLMMSDGLHTIPSSAAFMLSTQLNPMAEQNLVAPHCVCVVKKNVTNVLKDGRRVVIILDLEVLRSAEEVAGKIGDPTPYVEGQTKVASTAPSAPPRALQPQNGHDAFVSKGPSRDFTKKMPSTPGGSSKVVPIASLNPYQSKWTIRARVTNKSGIRTWSNSRGDGKLFSMEIVDESGEIRVTAFNQEVDKFFSLIEPSKVYYISKGTLKIANKQYTSLKNDYEMTLNGESTIIPCDDSQDVPMVHCDFVSISDLETKEKDAIVDVIGVCRSTEEITRITTKSSREVSKRTLNLMDMSGKVITVTLWGEEAEKFDGTGQPIIAIRGARLSDFGGRSLSALFSSTVMINPDIPEAYKLRGWSVCISGQRYRCVLLNLPVINKTPTDLITTKASSDSLHPCVLLPRYDKEGHTLDGQSMTELKSGGGGGVNTNWKTLTDVKMEHLGHGDKADYFSCVATIVYLRKENCLYQACPSQDCNKKVVDQHNGMFRCEKCDKEFPNFKYRLILSANIADFGDNQWVTCFQESAEAILGQNAAYLGQLKDSVTISFLQNEGAFEEVFQQANFKTYIFRNRVKLETYNDESRIKATVMDVKPVDHKEYSKRLIMNIRKLAAQ